MVKVLAEGRGWTATFMPKPFAHLTGTGAHFHMSLWDAASDTLLFADPTDELGLSPTAYRFIGGITAHAAGLAAITTPTVNSYKRMIAGNARSGATWAPVYVSYGGNNRTQMLRIPGPGRIENRAIDGSCNPYLAAAALLAAGLDAIERGLAAGPAKGRNMYELGVREREEAGIAVLPATLRDAVEALYRDDVLCAALGDTYARTYISSKLEEWRSYHDAVSQWEIDRYLEAY